MMLHLRDLGLLRLEARTVTGQTLGDNLAWWETSERRARLKEKLQRLDGIDPTDVIMSSDQAKARGLSSTVTFLGGNLAPEGALIKSTAIAPSRLNAQGIYDHEGPARVYGSEQTAIDAIKTGQVAPGDIMVLIGIGPGSGMPETYQVTSALKHVKGGDQIALITDGRFSGVSTGACVGHVSPEAWAGGPIGKVRTGDRIHLYVDTQNLEGRVSLMNISAEELQARPLNPDLKPDPRVPADTRLWAALQSASGGSWGGCVYDADRITTLMAKGLAAEGGKREGLQV